MAWRSRGAPCAFWPPLAARCTATPVTEPNLSCSWSAPTCGSTPERPWLVCADTVFCAINSGGPAAAQPASGWALTDRALSAHSATKSACVRHFFVPSTRVGTPRFFATARSSSLFIDWNSLHSMQKKAQARPKKTQAKPHWIMLKRAQARPRKQLEPRCVNDASVMVRKGDSIMIQR